MSSNNQEVDLDKNVYTTFDVAKICGANITSVKNWIREDDEVEFHETPGGHKRLKRDQLIDFLNKYDMPNPFAERRRKHVFAFCDDPSIEGRLREHFGGVHEYDATSDAAYALLKIGQWRPDAAIIDATLDGVDAMAVCESCDEILDLRPVELIVVHDGDAAGAEEFSKAGARFVVEKSDGEEAIFDAVGRILL